MLLLICLLIAFGTYALRATNLGSSWDIQVDEITYLNVSESIAAGKGPMLYGAPFFLHPPAYLITQAVVLRALNPTAGTVGRIHLLRHINAVYAALSALLVFYICAELAGRLAGALGALLFAIGPFVIRMNSHTLLDTSAGFWILVGWSILLLYSRRESPPPRHEARTIVAAGLAFAVALLTKESTALYSLVPLAVLSALGKPTARHLVVKIGAVALAIYSVYPITVALTGQWQPFVSSKTSGLLRFAGFVKTTGFRHSNGPSLAHALISNLSDYGTAYLLVLLGAIGLLVMLGYGDKQQRLIGTWSATTYIALVFSIAVGTLEEQFFYYLILPAVISAATGIADLFAITREPASGRHVRTATMTVLAVYLLWSLSTWQQVHFNASEANVELLSYLSSNVAAGTKISTTTEESQFLLNKYDIGIWTTPYQLARYKAQYLVLSTRQTANGYGYATPWLASWLQRSATIAFSSKSRTYGRLILYRLPPSSKIGLPNATDYGAQSLQNPALVPLQVSSSYSTQPGDTLSSVAYEFLGNAQAWQRVLNANRFLKGFDFGPSSPLTPNTALAIPVVGTNER